MTALLWLCSSSLHYDNFCTTDTGNKIKYRSIPRNTETQQENTKENTKKTTEINLIKNDFLISTSEDM